jgi:hypothetical protein
VLFSPFFSALPSPSFEFFKPVERSSFRKGILFSLIFV